MAVKTKKKIPVLRKVGGDIIPNNPWEQKPRKYVLSPEKEPVVPKPSPPPPPAEPHVAKQVEPEKLKLPDLKDFPVNIIELPKAIVNLKGEGLFSEQLGEEDKRRIINLNNLLGKGYKVKQVQFTERNTVVFILEK